MNHGLGDATPSVLVVEDDRATREFLTTNLQADRCDVTATPSAEDAMLALRSRRPDIAIIDVGLPGMTGLDLVGAIRQGGVDDPWDSGMPLVVISGNAVGHDAVRGFDRGADDFVGKPFHYPELLARMGVALRRAVGATRREELRVGRLAIDRHARRARLGSEVLPLSAKEFALLVALARDPHRVVAKAELLRDVWGYAGPVSRTRTVDSHASRLRRKLAAAGAGERYVANVWGVGYRLLPDDA